MAILGTTTNESDARLVEVKGTPGEAGFVLTRSWPWLAGKTSTSATGIAPLIVALNGVTTYTNPQANGRTYTGTFIHSDCYASDENGRISVTGGDDRATSITQVLTQVKNFSTVANMGTPDKSASKETLNFLGFKEGTKEEVKSVYSNLNSTGRLRAMALAPTTTATGYTITKRDWKVENDKTATLTVGFEKNTWSPKVWTTNKVKVAYAGYDARSNPETLTGRTGGSGLEEEWQLTGVNSTQWDEIAVKAQRGDTHRVVQNVTVVERANGEYVVSNRQGVSYDVTTATSAYIARITGQLLGAQQAGQARVWPRRTLAAKNTLTATNGEARKKSGTMLHDRVDITDHKDGTFTVTQYQTNVENATYFALTTAETYFAAIRYTETKQFHRTKDDKVKIIYYQKFIRCFPSEKASWNYITGVKAGITEYASDAAVTLIKGSSSVTRKDKYYWIARCGLQRSGAVVISGSYKIGVADWAALTTP